MGRAGEYTPLRGRIGGLTRAAYSDMAQLSKAGAVGLLRRFEAEVDPDGVLTPSERSRRATAAKKLHFARLALRSANARRRKAGASHLFRQVNTSSNADAANVGEAKEDANAARDSTTE